MLLIQSGPFFHQENIKCRASEVAGGHSLVLDSLPQPRGDPPVPHWELPAQGGGPRTFLWCRHEKHLMHLLIQPTLEEHCYRETYNSFVIIPVLCWTSKPREMRTMQQVCWSWGPKGCLRTAPDNPKPPALKGTGHGVGYTSLHTPLPPCLQRAPACSQYPHSLLAAPRGSPSSEWRHGSRDRAIITSSPVSSASQLPS